MVYENLVFILNMSRLQLDFGFLNNVKCYGIYMCIKRYLSPISQTNGAFTKPSFASPNVELTALTTCW